MQILPTPAAPTGATPPATAAPISITLRTATHPEGVEITVSDALGLRIASLLLDYATQQLRHTSFSPTAAA